MRHVLAVLVLAAASAPLEAGSAPVPVGPEFQVNTYTFTAQGTPAIATDADGDFVVVWQSLGSSGSDTFPSYSIQGQRYSAAGAPQGAEFQVNSYTTSVQINAAIAADDDGDFVVVWESNGSSGGDTLNTSAQGQRYSAAGAPQGTQFQVNSYTTNEQRPLAIATDADGDFVVVWESYGSSGDDSSLRSIQGQRYSAAGAPQGAQFEVNSYTTHRQLAPAIAAAADGDFVVVWHSYGASDGDTSSYSVQGQRYSAAGAPQGAQFQVNSYTTGVQRFTAIASAADGDFVVVWVSDGSSGDDSSALSIQGQRYSAAGAPQAAQFEVNSYTTNNQLYPAIAADADGDFVVVWQSYGSSGGDSAQYSIQGQRYSAAGAPQGAQFQVNSYTPGQQRFPAIAAAADGDFVVVWDGSGSSGGDHDDSVQGRRFRVTGDLQGTVFLDRNSDGIHDVSEPGVAGIAVELYDLALELHRTAVTDANGDYALRPKEGNWIARFVPPASGGFTFTAENVGDDDEVDSDADHQTGWTDLFPMTIGLFDDTLDAGILPDIFADGFESGDRSAWSATVP